MFQSNSIGVSSHKNEYKAGVRVGNWVEELAGREAEAAPAEAKDTLKAFMKSQEQAQIAKSSTVGRAARSDPKQAVDGTMLFSHGTCSAITPGPVFGGKFQASMSALHYTDPAARAYGCDSQDRVHKTFFFGNKHIDRVVPLVEPHPRYELMQAKAPPLGHTQTQTRGSARLRLLRLLGVCLAARGRPALPAGERLGHRATRCPAAASGARASRSKVNLFPLPLTIQATVPRPLCHLARVPVVTRPANLCIHHATWYIELKRYTSRRRSGARAGAAWSKVPCARARERSESAAVVAPRRTALAYKGGLCWLLAARCSRVGPRGCSGAQWGLQCGRAARPKSLIRGFRHAGTRASHRVAGTSLPTMAAQQLERDPDLP